MLNRQSSGYVRAGTGFLAGLLISGGAVGALAGENPSTGGTYRATTSGVEFTAARYHQHVEVLAHDLLRGRDTGSDGIDIAAGYLAGQFASIGLKPGGPDGTYFQDFTLSLGGKVLESTTLTITGAEAPALARGETWTPFGWSSQGSFSGDLVFVGYGVTNPEKNYDDYAGVEVSGKIVFMLRREPASFRAEGAESPAFSRFSWFASKARLAKEKGAVAMIVTNQATEDADVLPGSAMDGQNYGIPAVQVKREVAEALLKAAGMEPLAEVQRKLDGGLTRSQAMPGVSASGQIAFEGTSARNVLGVLPGTGLNADEYIVIGAHYDHIGDSRGAINNGADDNASGTAGVIEVARAMALTPNRNRSLLFMGFTAEERGLLGSAHFCANPTVPVEKIVAMLNMDMIGRLSDDSANDQNHLYIQGLGTGDVFKDLVARQSKACGFMQFNPDDSARGPSDHASFNNVGVPSLFFFTGLHEDYHAPGDDTPKINVDGGARIARLVYEIGLELANADKRPVFARVDTPADIRRGSVGSRTGTRGPRLGIMPGADDGKKGYPVARVLAGMPAEKAGMKEGDRILRIGDAEVNGQQDLVRAIEGKRAGDELEVRILRGTEEMTLRIILAPPPAPST